MNRLIHRFQNHLTKDQLKFFDSRSLKVRSNYAGMKSVFISVFLVFDKFQLFHCYFKAKVKDLNDYGAYCIVTLVIARK